MIREGGRVKKPLAWLCFSYPYLFMTTPHLINFIMFAESILDIRVNKGRVSSLLNKLEAVNENLATWLRDREPQGYIISDYWKPDHLDELYRLLEQVRQLN